MLGRIESVQSSHPTAVNQPSLSEKSMMSSGPSTMLGTLTPTIATVMVE